ISPRGHWLEQKLDQMEVETKWQAGVHVNWETGLLTEFPNDCRVVIRIVAPSSRRLRNGWEATF
ncbi:MAG: hypothetical protein WCC41_06310, partial [Rhodomicrobium sp.]